MEQTTQAITSTILSKDIVAVVKDSCPYCVSLKSALTRLGLLKRALFIGEADNLFAELRSAVKDKFLHKTVPAVFIRGRFVGGYDSFQKIEKSVSNLLSLPFLDRTLVLTKEGVVHAST